MSAVMKSAPANAGRQLPRIDFAVVGLGLSGQSVLKFLRGIGASVVALDTREQPPEIDAIRAAYPEVSITTGELSSALIKNCDRIVLSPGVSLDEPLIREAIAQGREVIGDIELFAQHATAPVIAITGTNGKSTVTTLVADILQACGHEVRRGANLGPPALDLLEHAEPDYYVLELSSFQLQLTSALAPAVACILNITPDHLDRHGSFENYVSAKAGVLEHAEVAVMNADDPTLRAYACTGRRVDFSLSEPGTHVYGVREEGGRRVLVAAHGAIMAVDELKIHGEHNVANALAAIAIAEACGAPQSAIVSVLRNFSGLAHRAELVATINDTVYVNDSKATNPGAAAASIYGIMSPNGGVVIAGGASKGVSFEPFAEALCANAHTVVLIGEAAQAIEQAVRGRINCLFATTMASAVDVAANAAKRNETVLLAPACASFDQFANYRERGDAFRRAVTNKAEAS